MQFVYGHHYLEITGIMVLKKMCLSINSNLFYIFSSLNKVFSSDLCLFISKIIWFDHTTCSVRATATLTTQALRVTSTLQLNNSVSCKNRLFQKISKKDLIPSLMEQNFRSCKDEHKHSTKETHSNLCELVQ